MISMFSRRICLVAAGAAVAVSLLPAAAHAVVVHRYTFSGNANDSVGTANGVVVDSGAVTAAYNNGYLMLTGNTGQASNVADASRDDAYVDLPNGIVKAAAQGGTAGAVSFEYWFTIANQRTWQRIGDFGTANGGENMSDSGSTSNYLLMTPNSGNFSNGLAMTNHHTTGAEPGAGLTGPFPIGRESHVVAVYDKNDTSGGTRPGGTMTLYLNGAQVAQGLISEVFQFDDTFVDNNNWLGRSQWPDPFFDGLYNEVAIYNHAVTQAEVTANFAAGPVGGKSTPTLTVNRDNGSVVLSNVGASWRVTGYSLTSGTGTLIPENFNPISFRLDFPIGDGSFDSDDSWATGANLSPTLLDETIQPGGAGDGGLLSTNTVTLNTAGNRLWTKYYQEDVRMMLQVQVGTQLLEMPATVNFTGNGGMAYQRGDLNFDNAINAADYEIFRSNHRKAITAGLTDPQSYVFGDLDGDQDNDFADFRIFQGIYTAANGEAAFAALLANVPEPSGVVLVAMGLVAGAMRRRRGA